MPPELPPPVFVAATLRLYGARVLIVIVPPATLGDPCEARLVIEALARRTSCVVVLVARDAIGVPTYYGPERIARVLAAIPFDALSWRRYRKRPPPIRLPIPAEPEELDACDSTPPPTRAEANGTPTRVLRK